MNYEAWRIQYQSSEQAARAAFAEWQRVQDNAKIKKNDVNFARDALKATRYGVAWEGEPKKPTHKEMEDGYWVPWHVADILIEGLLNTEVNAD